MSDALRTLVTMAQAAEWARLDKKISALEAERDALRLAIINALNPGESRAIEILEAALQELKSGNSYDVT